MFLGRFTCLRGLRNAPALVIALACSLVSFACGGGSRAGATAGIGRTICGKPGSLFRPTYLVAQEQQLFVGGN